MTQVQVLVGSQLVERGRQPPRRMALWGGGRTHVFHACCRPLTTRGRHFIVAPSSNPLSPTVTVDVHHGSRTHSCLPSHRALLIGTPTTPNRTKAGRHSTRFSRLVLESRCIGVHPRTSCATLNGFSGYSEATTAAARVSEY